MNVSYITNALNSSFMLLYKTIISLLRFCFEWYRKKKADNTAVEIRSASRQIILTRRYLSIPPVYKEQISAETVYTTQLFPGLTTVNVRLVWKGGFHLKGWLFRLYSFYQLIC
jgi:hypothetical protein